jgi:Zn-dependent protease
LASGSLYYTSEAQACLSAARVEAQARHAPQVEPEHLLMALLTPASGAVWNALVGTLGDPSPLRKRADAALSPPPIESGVGEPPPSHRLERVLRDAGDAAKSSGALVDTPHLLIGLLDEGGAAANILRQAGIDARRLRLWLRKPPEVSQMAPPSAALRPPGLRRDPRTQQARAGGRWQSRLPVVTFRKPRLQPALDTLPLRQALPRLIDWRAVLALLAVLAIGAWLATQPDYETAGAVFLVVGGWIVSLCAHEFAHALAADLGGDYTVRQKGYLSFNPLAYTHPLLSIVMPLLFLLLGGFGLPGGAVYVETHRLRSLRWNSIVSAAGPLASMLMALIFALPFLFSLVSDLEIYLEPVLWGALAAVAMLNVSGVLFNLLPIPPLDGFGIIAPWLPPEVRQRLSLFGFLGLWLVILAFWTIEPLSQSFWNAVYSILEILRIDPGLAAYGISRFMFWRG